MLEVQEKENNKALIEDLRKRLLSRGPELQDFNEDDIEKVQKDDHYVWQFLVHKGKDVDRALEMMVECLKWRETFGLNEITERNIDRHLFEIGFLYPRNKDKSGNLLLLFHTRLYKKELYNLEEVKKLVAFGLEKMMETNSGKKITMIFDMQDSGLANMDMDLIKFVITCFQTYFPNFLEYLIVFETPWILTAAWKIVKTWLSTEGISKIKFVKKNEIFLYAEQDQLLSSMGGTDTFIYKYPPQLFTTNVGNNMRYSPSTRNKHNNSNLAPSSKQDVFSSLSLNVDERLLLQHKHHDETDKVPSKSKPIIKTEIVEPIVSIIPSHELMFCASTSLSGEPYQSMKITNNTNKVVAFKIKTTSPENYRVKPSSGKIPPEETVEINVQLQRGHMSGVSKDKFLIMTTILSENETVDSNMWKSLPKSNIYEQRLRCRYDSSATQSAESDRESTNSPKRISEDHNEPLAIISRHLMDFDVKMDNIQKQVSSMERDIKILFRVIIVFFFIILLLLAAFFIYYTKIFYAFV